MNEKSTHKTSRKIYAMKFSFAMLVFVAVIYSVLVASGFNPSELVFGALIAGISSIVTALNIADGMKGHE